MKIEDLLMALIVWGGVLCWALRVLATGDWSP